MVSKVLPALATVIILFYGTGIWLQKLLTQCVILTKGANTTLLIPSEKIFLVHQGCHIGEIKEGGRC